ncbi:MAG: lipopolysaccharide biosynthesis protein [Acidimicrobiales bacterium]
MTASGGLGRLVERAGVGGGMLQRAGWSTVVEVLQLVSSVLIFLILANLMSAEEYGLMSAVIALAIPAAGLSSFGSHILLMKRVAQGMDVPEAWARATSIGIVGPALGAVVMIALRPAFLPSVGPLVYTLLIVSQMSLFWLCELAVYLGTGARRLKESAQIRLIIVVCRLAALAGFALFTERTLLDWAWASFASFGLAAFLALVFVWRVFGATPAVWRIRRRDLTEGFPFSTNAVTESLIDVSDRPLLARYGHEADAGVYSLGARIIQFGYLPLRIVMRASDADLFEAGKHGTRSALRLTFRLLRPVAGLGLAVTVGAFLVAPILPWLVGDHFADSVSVLRWLAVMPTIRAVQYLMGNCLGASDKQPWRLAATAAAGVVNFGLNLVFLPNGGWRTAVVTTLVGEVFLTVCLTGLALWFGRPRRDDDKTIDLSELRTIP